MFKINTLQNNERMSTQDLLQAINAAVAAGETEFSIEASGQHDIGGPLWHPEGKTLRFYVTNPGQRVGCMCLDNTEIYVEAQPRLSGLAVCRVISFMYAWKGSGAQNETCSNCLFINISFLTALIVYIHSAMDSPHNMSVS